MTPTLTLWRRRLVQGDPERDFTYCWTVDPFSAGEVGGPELPAILRSATGQSIDLEVFWFRPRAWFEPFHCGIGLPRAAVVVPGSYDLIVGTINLGAITVSNVNPKTARVVVDPVNSTTAIEKALGSGNVIFSPGLYTFERAINIPPGCNLSGYGAIIQAPRFANPSAANKIFNTIGQDVTIEGFKFKLSDSLSFTSTSGLVLVECEFEANSWHRGAVGRRYYDYNGGGVSLIGNENLMRSCRFRKGASLWAEAGMILDCDWDGRPAGLNHSLACNRTTGPLAVIGVKMNDTDRGPVIRPLDDDITDALITDIILTNIRTEYNGCELIGAEGSHELKRTIFSKIQSVGCVGEMHFETKMSNCLIQGCFLDGCDMSFVAPSDWPQTNNRIWNCELRGGQMTFGPNFKGNDVYWCGIFAPQPYTRNQFFAHPNYYNQAKASAAGITDQGANGARIREVFYAMQDGVPTIVEAAI